MFSQLPMETQAHPQPSSFTSVHLHSLEHSWKRQRLQEVVCLPEMFTGRRWDPARKATVVTVRVGQGEEELLSELSYFQNVSPFLPGSKPVTASFQGTAPGQYVPKGAPEGHLRDVYGLP